jgi:hypothetical protein
MDYTPHFTVGNMKRSLDVVAATGDKIVALWADPYVFLCFTSCSCTKETGCG